MHRLGFYSVAVLLVCGLILPVSGRAQETRYDPLITATARRYGLEASLVKAVIHCESGFDAQAQSPRGAQGLMQLMPATQVFLGVKNAFDPQHNVAGGTRYLAMLKQQFASDITLMLAGYNAGPQAVIDAGYKVPPYAETQQYIVCVQQAWQHYQRYGLQQTLSAKLLTPKNEYVSPTLVVRPLRFSEHKARLGQRLTVYLEALNTGSQTSEGVVMVNYPEELVSSMALHTTVGDETTVQLPPAPDKSSPSSVSSSPSYQLLWNHWSAWRPGERRTAAVVFVPRVAQDITIHLSIVLNRPTASSPSQRWSSVLQIPFRTTTW